VNRRQTAASRERDAAELSRAVEAFLARADGSEVATLARIVKRWPQMRTLTKDALFASIVVEFKKVLEVENVPAVHYER
jgi:hypothetical protein